MLLAALASLACTSEPRSPIADFTLVAAGGPPRAVHLPATLPVPSGASEYTLEHELSLGPDLRGADLVLVLPRFYAFATLRVETDRIAPLEGAIWDRYRPSSSTLSFRIPARFTDRERLPIAIDVARRSDVADLVPETPYLVRGEWADAELRGGRTFNQTTAIGATTVFLFLSIAMAVRFALDRRRRAEGWFALMAAGLAGWHLAVLGATQPIVPNDYMVVPIVTTYVIAAAVYGFVVRHLDVGRPSRLVLAAYALGGVVNLALLRRGFEPASVMLDLATVASVIYQLWILAPVIRRGRRRVDAVSLAANWLLFLGAMIANRWLEVATLKPLAWVVFVVTQAVMLVRANAETLRGLNAELAARLNDVAALNDELRRQVGDRSARLVEAISRLGSSGAAEEPALKPGQTIGDRYRIVRELGTGAMGTVCEVSRMSDGRRFALKMLRQVRGTASLARFAREAQIAARLVHPNVVGIVDFDVTPGGLPFMVMDLVKRAEAKPGDVARSLDVLAQAAEGLAALHAAGIVHRDLKPSNVLVEELAGGGVRARIADFGISRFDEPFEAAGETGAPGDDLPPASLTRTGVVIGTPMYIAPELARGSRDALPSSDLWSFGVLAYELLTGSLPFARAPVIEMIRREGADALTIPKQKLPEVARAIVTRCLRIDPTERPTAAEVAEALRSARRAPPAAHPPKNAAHTGTSD